MAIKNWNGFKKNGDSYIPNDATAKERIGTLSSLLTTAKDNLVAAINEVFTKKISWADAGKSVKKNLLVNTATSGTYSNVTATVNVNKTISLSGTSNSNDMALFIMGRSWGTSGIDIDDTELEIGGSYILSKGFIQENASLFLRFYNSSGTDLGGVASKGSNDGATFTVPNNTKYIVCVFRANNGVNVTGKVVKPMIRKASILDDTYAPYIPDNTELMTWEANGSIGSKNILPRYNDTSENDVSITVDENGVGTINGQASASAKLRGHGYLVSAIADFCAQNPNVPLLLTTGKSSVREAGQPTLQIYYWSAETGFTSYGSNDGNPFTIPAVRVAAKDFGIQFSINNGDSFDNVKVYPMLRLASDNDPNFKPPVLTNSRLSNPIYTSVYDIIENASVLDNVNYITKVGRFVELDLALTGVTATAWTSVIASIPAYYRPIKEIFVNTLSNKVIKIQQNGQIKAGVNLSNEDVRVHACWLSSEWLS